MEKYKICVPISEKTPEKVLKSAQSYIEQGADLLEIRIDALKSPTPPMVAQLIKEVDFITIATNRIASEGGLFKGSEKERTDILIAAADEADYVDIEILCKDKYRSKVIESAHKSIISFHDFEKTPSLEYLQEIVKKESQLGDIAKFAVTPKNMGDTVTVLNVLKEYPETVAISMGNLGKYTRIMGPLFGAPFTFASAGHSTAPGQLDIKTTRLLMEKLSINKG